MEPGVTGVPGEPVALRPLRVGEILDVAIKVYRANFKTLIKAVLVIIAPVQILTTLLSSSMRSITDNSGSFNTTGTVDVNGGQVAAVVAAVLAIALLGFVSGQLASATAFRAVSEAYLGEVPDWRRSLRFAVSRLRSLLWLALLHGLLIAVGFVLCIVPGIYFYGALSVATPALLLEDVRGTKALRRSRELVKTRWWPTAGALLVGSLLVTIVGTAVSGILVAATASTDNRLVSDIMSAIGGTASSMVTTPFLAAVIVVIYFDLRVRKEGFDLLLLAQHMGVEPTMGVAPVSFIPEPPPVFVDGDEPPFWPPPPGWKPRSES